MKPGLEWPLGIALGLCGVVMVNIAFIYIAASDPPQIDVTYETGRR